MPCYLDYQAAGKLGDWGSLTGSLSCTRLSKVRPAEPSVLVLGLSLEAAKVMGRQYEQDAIVWISTKAVPELVLLQ